MRIPKLKIHQKIRDKIKKIAKIPRMDPSIRIPKIEDDSLKGKIVYSKRKLNKKRLAIIASSILIFIVALIFFSKSDFTAFSIKEKAPVCNDECELEGKLCENAKIFECSLGEDGCKHKSLVESCPDGAVCSTLSKDSCYTPQFCDGDFHLCISDVFYKMCKNGKTVEGGDNKRCPDGLMCNRNPKRFAICIEKDY